MKFSVLLSLPLQRIQWLALSISVYLWSSVSLASTPPRIVTDIPPTHSLVSMVMGDLGSPELLMEGSVSPHDYALRPSDAKVLTQADLVIWMHPELTPWLDTGLAGLAPSTLSIILMEQNSVEVLPAREKLNFLEEVAVKGAHGHEHHHVHTIDFLTAGLILSMPSDSSNRSPIPWLTWMRQMRPCIEPTPTWLGLKLKIRKYSSINSWPTSRLVRS